MARYTEGVFGIDLKVPNLGSHNNVDQTFTLDAQWHSKIVAIAVYFRHCCLEITTMQKSCVKNTIVYLIITTCDISYYQVLGVDQ